MAVHEPTTEDTARVSLVKAPALASEPEPEFDQEPGESGRRERLAQWARRRIEAVRPDDGQRALVAARIKAWFAAADICDAELATAVTDRKLRAQQARGEQLAREVTRLRIRVEEAKVREAGADEGGAGGGEVHRVRGQLVTAEARLQAYTPAAILPPTEREIRRARTGRRLFRAAMVAAAAVGWLRGVMVSPLVLLGTAVAVPIAWRVLARRDESGPQRPAESGGDQRAAEPVSVPGPAAGPWTPPPAPVAAVPAQAAQTPAAVQVPNVVQAPATEAASNAAGPVYLSADQVAEDRTPFPIARARTPEDAVRALMFALLKEGVPVADITDVRAYGWGWEMLVRISSGTPAVILDKAADLETLLDMPAGGVSGKPMVERRACITVRLVMSDPFTQMRPAPARSPKSMSIADPAVVGASLGGAELELALAGLMGEVIAASGGGKSMMLRALADVTTACRDCITIDLDPTGDGLGPYSEAARLKADTGSQIESVLLFLLQMAKGRGRIRRALGMGNEWRPSSSHPAFVTIIDEFPKLTPLAKRLALELLLIGRKEAVWLIIAAQGGQESYLGANIAAMVALKLVGACKVEDTRSVFGPGAGAEGWLPHKLRPKSGRDLKDVCRFYLQGAPGIADEPEIYKVHFIPDGEAERRAAERRAAGFLEPDTDSLDAMVLADLPVVPTSMDLPDLLAWPALLRLCGAPAPAVDATQVSEEELRARVAVRACHTAMTGQGRDAMQLDELAAHLAGTDPNYADLTSEQLGELLRCGGAGGTVKVTIDGRRVNGYRASTLADALT